MYHLRGEREIFDESRTNQTRTLKDLDTAHHYGKLFRADDEICVFMCLTKTENEKARGTL